ncbi:hypothetical protein KGF54_002013 [Candida jiufengensis]|uniref:uncharacterized protein n=1 Tax=Candida jiufengensis TaxID=497108 RepID=UPI00222540B0|nr:uncharacterized protein KGF54_002013 [Candida jiufengensis]KAI5954238.1 hypothetical protein KGF54_002013 [Candida jiufengensis]
MSAIPLYLKIKGQNNAQTYNEYPCFDVLDNNSIEFNDTTYDFEYIYQHNENNYKDLIETSHNSCIVLMGPTNSGKTTMLKQLVNLKLKKLNELESPVFVSSFEISNNKYLSDLLDVTDGTESKKIPFSYITNFENKLKRTKPNQELIKNILKQRLSKCTEFNENSSRSCLIMTFFYNNTKTTFVDLMGNEKNSSLSSNIFANSNISSITQTMVNKSKSDLKRSHNLITNYIFKNKDLKIVLNLDQFGDLSLIKSNLNNVADVVKNFKLPTTSNETDNVTRRVPSYTLPTMSSSRHSPRKIMRPLSAPHVPTIQQSTSTYHKKPLEVSNKITKPIITKIRSPRKPPVPRRGPSKETLIIQALEAEQQQLKQKYFNSIEDIKLEISGFKGESTQLVETFTKLKNNLVQLESENSKKTETIDSIKEENLRYVEKLVKVSEELSALQALKIENEEEISALEGQKLKLEKVIEAGKDEVSKLGEERQDLNNQISKLQNEATTLHDRIRSLNETIVDNKQNLASRNARIVELEDEKVIYQKEINEMINQQDKLKSELTYLEAECVNLKHDLDSQKAQREKFITEIDILKGSIVAKDTEISNLKSSGSETEGKVEHSQQQIKQLKEKIHEKNQEMTKLNSSINQLQNQLNNAKDLEKDLRSSVSSTKSELNNLHETHQQRLKNEQSKFDIQKNELNAKILNLESFSSEKDRKIKQLEDSLKKESELSKSLQSNNTKLSNELTTNENLNLELSTIKLKLKSKVDRVLHLEDKFDKVTKEKETLNDRLQSNETQNKANLSNLKRKYDSIISEKDAEIKRLKGTPSSMGTIMNDSFTSNNGLFINSSSPNRGSNFNPNDIFQDSVIEPTINFHNKATYSNNRSTSSTPKAKNKSSAKSNKNSISGTPIKNKNVLQPSNKQHLSPITKKSNLSSPHSASKMKGNSVNNHKSSPLKTLQA